MVKYKNAKKPNIVKLSVRAKCRHGMRHPYVLMSKFKSKLHKPVKRCTKATRYPKIPVAILSNFIEEFQSAKSKAQTRNGIKEKDERDLCTCHENSFDDSPDGVETFSTEEMNYDSFLEDADNSHFSESDMENDDEPLHRSLDTSHHSDASKCELITAVNGNRIAQAPDEDEECSDQWVTEDTETDVGSQFAASPPKKVVKHNPLESIAQYSKDANQKARRRLIKKPAVEQKSPRDEENYQLSTETEWETVDESSYERTSESQTDTSPTKMPNTHTQKTIHRIFSENANSFILVLDHPAQLSMQGKIEVSVLWGCLSVNGFYLRPQTGFIPIYSPSTTSSVLISTYRDNPATPSSQLETKAFEEFWKSQDIHLFSTSDEIPRVIQKTVGLQCKCLSNAACSYVERFFPNVFNIDRQIPGFFSPEKAEQYGCQFYNANYTKIRFIKSDKHWEEVTKDVIQYTQSDDAPPRIIVCGGKRVGKSTFGRYMLNSLLNVCAKVSFIDADPGQSEFTPSGLVSLLEITEPCFGPAFTHLQDAELSFFVGGTTVSDCPSHFIDCIGKLWKMYSDSVSRATRFFKQPLLINTMGWNQGMGAALLMDIIHIVQPTHVIQIHSQLHQSKNFFPLFLRNISHTPGWEFEFPVVEKPYAHYILKSMVSNKKDFSQITTRVISFLSYFSRLQKSSKFKPVNQLKSFKVPWSTVALHVCQTNVLNSQILYVYNASIVALCICDETKMTSSADPTLPKFIRDIPVCKFLGYGIIRGISMKEKCFHIVTYLDYDYLRQVNALLKGTIEMPKEILLEQDVGGPIPYLFRRNVSSNMKIGHKPVPRRNFIGKQKRMSPKKNHENPNFIPLFKKPLIPPLNN